MAVYSPTPDMFEEWRAEAALHGVSVIRFIDELVDNMTGENAAQVTPLAGRSGSFVDLAPQSRQSPFGVTVFLALVLP